jgi:hypothetical protein
VIFFLKSHARLSLVGISRSGLREKVSDNDYIILRSSRYPYALRDIILRIIIILLKQKAEATRDHYYERIGSNNNDDKISMDE